jgi:hypothetical protein
MKKKNNFQRFFFSKELFGIKELRKDKQYGNK